MVFTRLKGANAKHQRVLQAIFMGCSCQQDRIGDAVKIWTHAIGNDGEFLAWRLKVGHEGAANLLGDGADYVGSLYCLRHDFFKIRCELGHSIFRMVEEGEIMDCDNLAEIFTDRGQGEIWTMVDIDLAGEIVRVERQTPAIPDNIQVAVRNKNTASPYVLRSRKRTLPRGASAGEQGILIAGILGQHGIDQSTHIVTYASALANGCCIVNGDMHETYYYS